MPKKSTFEDAVKMSNTVVERIMGIEGIDTTRSFPSGLMESIGGAGRLY